MISSFSLFSPGPCDNTFSWMVVFRQHRPLVHDHMYKINRVRSCWLKSAKPLPGCGAAVDFDVLV